MNTLHIYLYDLRSLTLCFSLVLFKSLSNDTQYKRVHTVIWVFLVFITSSRSLQMANNRIRAGQRISGTLNLTLRSNHTQLPGCIRKQPWDENQRKSVKRGGGLSSLIKIMNLIPSCASISISIYCSRPAIYTALHDCA